MFVKITPKGGLISEGILTLVTLPKRGAENLNKLFTAQWRDLAPFLAIQNTF